MVSKKTITRFFLLLAMAKSFAQEVTSDTQIEQLEQTNLPLTPLDSLKATFVKHEKVTQIDSLWIEKMTSSELYEEWSKEMQNFNFEEDLDFDISTEVFKYRLGSLNEKTEFDLRYNPIVERVVKTFLNNRKKSLQRIMALAEYYFPLFEEKLDQYGLPLELKYLPIIESALNPRAVSRAGASGLWQFMYLTGKMHDLKVNYYIDERYDPVKSTEAACQYLSSLYKMYGNWELVLAAYNAGPGNVNKAIRRSKGEKNYWNIRVNLPKETQGYVPQFLATVYIFEYHKEHKIIPEKRHIPHFETDSIQLKRKMSFQQISDLLDISVDEIRFMNPIYKLGVVPHYLQKPSYIRLPVDKIGLFTSNEDKIYAYIDSEKSKKEEAIAFEEQIPKSRYHTIRRGENLTSIARKYGVSVGNLKKWNNIAGTSIQAGKKLKIM